MHQLTRLVGQEASIGSEAALDFGCGVGRLTQALAKHFSRVVGIDVSEPMVAHARRLNRHGERVTYYANPRADLRVVGDARFDVVYTDLVLQHMPPAQALGYIAEFVRVLRPGGFLVFQLPSHKRAELAPDIKPMPMDAYRAAIRLTAPPVSWPAHGTVRLEANVRNLSTAVWDQQTVGALRLGNHWLAANGDMLVQDDGRAWLPEVLRPGEEVALVLDVTVPDVETAALLELDLVHEGHSWFADKGSPTLRLPVTRAAVHQPLAERTMPNEPPRTDDLLLPFLTSEAGEGEEVDFPMHGIPRDAVVDYVASRGAELLHCESDDRGGREWVGYRYFFRMRQG
jgi:SAM-dependent methyltransferase